MTRFVTRFARAVWYTALGVLFALAAVLSVPLGLFGVYGPFVYFGFWSLWAGARCEQAWDDDR